MAGDELTCWAGTSKLSNAFHALHDELIVVELTSVGVQSSFSAWCQLHYGDMYAVVHFCCCAPPFSVFCCPRLSLRLHSLLTSMVSPPTYGSQCTPSPARASFVGVLSGSLHRSMRICFAFFSARWNEWRRGASSAEVQEGGLCGDPAGHQVCTFCWPFRRC